jgi:hypothetical protein
MKIKKWQIFTTSKSLKLVNSIGKEFLMIPALILILGLVASCADEIEDKTIAEDAAKSYFNAIRDKDFDKALTFYSPEFFKRTSHEVWLQTLKTMNAKLGDLKSYELIDWRFQKNIGMVSNDTFYLMKYKVIYSKYSAEERLDFIKPASGDEIKIIGHSINSEGLSK